MKLHPKPVKSKQRFTSRAYISFSYRVKFPIKLTPRGCSRLMGFDTPQGCEFIIPVSYIQAYRQFGNAVVVPVVRAITQLLKPYLEKAIDNSN